MVSVREFAAYLCWPAILAFGQNCAPDPRPIPAPAQWHDAFTAALPGVRVDVEDGSERITEPITLAQRVLLPYPASAQGALSTSVYPQGPPWAFNPTAPSVCPDAPAGADCSGHRIPRNPGRYLRSALHNSARGFEFTGSFGGQLAPTYKPGSMLVQSVFFHENPLYFGGAEYGFYYELTPGWDGAGKYYPARLVFYWSTNSNCGYQPSICRTERNGGKPLYENGATGPPPLTRVHGCAIPVPQHRMYRYQTWLFKDTDKRWKFRVRVVDPRDGKQIVPAMTVDPNVSGGNWFPIAELARPGHKGYYTAGIVKSDPHQSMKVAEPAVLKVQRLRVAAAAQPATTIGK